MYIAVKYKIKLNQFDINRKIRLTNFNSFQSFFFSYKKVEEKEERDEKKIRKGSRLECTGTGRKAANIPKFAR